MNESITEVILDKIELTENISIQRIALLERGYFLGFDGSLPIGHYVIYIRVVGEGGGYCYPTIMDGNSDILTNVEEFICFKNKGKDYDYED